MASCDQIVTNSSSFQLTRAYSEGVIDGYLLHAYTPAKSLTSVIGRTMRLRSLGLLVTLALGILAPPVGLGATARGFSPGREQPAENGLYIG